MKFTALRVVLTLATTAALIISTTAFACSKNQLISFAEDAAASLKAAQPHIIVLLPDKAEAWANVVLNAEKLVAAVKASDKQGALNLLADITPVLNEVVASMGANVRLMTILAIADIALHFLVNHINVDPAVVSANPKLGKLLLFKNQAVWGCNFRKDYHPELCR